MEEIRGYSAQTETAPGKGGGFSLRARNKPNSVSPASSESHGRDGGDGHLSGPSVTLGLVRPTRASSGAGHTSALFGLAPGGVCRAPSVTLGAVVSYTTFSPLPRRRRGGIFSVALSVEEGSLPPPPRFSRGTLPCGVRTFLPLALSSLIASEATIYLALKIFLQKIYSGR